MTEAVININNPSFWLRTNSTGSSAASRTLQAILNRNIKDLRKSETWNRKGDAFALLRETYENCSVKNWDGYGAHPILAAAYDDASSFLNAIPANIPVPDITPEPDGTVGLDWDNGRYNTFTVILNGKGSIVYAGILGKGNKSHGTEVFDDTIPENIINIIKRVYS